MPRTIFIRQRSQVGVLLGALALSGVAYLFAWYPSLFGWPGGFVVNRWTPSLVRRWALASFEEGLSKDDLPRLKEMLRSGDPRLRLRGILLIDRFQSIEVSRELSRLTRDEDSRVRRMAHKFTEPYDRADVVAVHARGLQDESEEVVATAADWLCILDAKEALPDLIAYLRKTKKPDSFTGAEVAVGNAAARIAGLKYLFHWNRPRFEAAPAHGRERCEQSWDMPWQERFVHAYGQPLSRWREGIEVPDPLGEVSPSAYQLNIAQRDALLAWWQRRKGPR